jgi:hypothetical protein
VSSVRLTVPQLSALRFALCLRIGTGLTKRLNVVLGVGATVLQVHDVIAHSGDSRSAFGQTQDAERLSIE